MSGPGHVDFIARGPGHVDFIARGRISRISISPELNDFKYVLPALNVHMRFATWRNNNGPSHG